MPRLNLAAQLRVAHGELAMALPGAIDAALRQRYAAVVVCRMVLAVLLRRAGAAPGGALGAGLLAPHPLECEPAGVPPLPASRLAALQALLESQDWHLDELAAPDRPGPALLGAVVEQAAARKPSGAYYTSRDVAAYLARATLIPALLDRLALQAPALAGPHGLLWALIQADPHRYLFADLAHGTSAPLPDAIAAGCYDPARREHWNQPAPAHLALPGETWREVMARRTQYAEACAALAAGNVHSAGALITWNLDLLRLVHDLIARCDDPAALAALWQALEQLYVLDPTCGAGDLLIAALAVLEPIYAACLARMQSLPVDGATATILARAAQSASSQAFVRHTILAHNLHGVDLLDEAAAICRLRLQLALLASLPTGVPSGTLPDLVTQIRSGNALTGVVPARAPALGARDTRVAAGHGVLPDLGADPGEQAGARPLHWPEAFPQVLAGGGFSAVIANPPYVTIRRDTARYGQFRTASSGNMYALVIEQALTLLRPGGRLGVIVPVASVATGAMAPLQQLYADLPQWHSHYAVRPGKLFPGVDMNLTISLVQATPAPGQAYTSGYRRWSNRGRGERARLFTTLRYTLLPRLPGQASPYPKLGSPLEVALYARLLAHGRTLRAYADPHGVALYYHSGGRYWRKALPFKQSSHYKPLLVRPEVAPVVLALLNSQLFYWYWISHSNCMDLVAREVLDLPVFALETVDPAPYAALVAELLRAYAAGSRGRMRRGVRIRGTEVQVDMRLARPVIDAIDAALAGAYGLSAEDLDFVRNYDIKYREP